MSFSNALLVHATQLLEMQHFGPRAAEMRNISQRRAVSAAYYALFHHINESRVALIAPNVPPGTNHRIQRWFEHAEMKKICGRFIKAKLDQPLLDLIGNNASADLQNTAGSFILLQEARHNADYNLSYALTSEEALQFVQLGAGAMYSWDQSKAPPKPTSSSSPSCSGRTGTGNAYSSLLYGEVITQRCRSSGT